jgi:hypothetical protein
VNRFGLFSWHQNENQADYRNTNHGSGNVYRRELAQSTEKRGHEHTHVILKIR